MDDKEGEPLSQVDTWFVLAKDCLHHWEKHHKNVIKHLKEASIHADLAQFELREFLKCSKKHFGENHHG